MSGNEKNQRSNQFFDEKIEVLAENRDITKVKRSLEELKFVFDQSCIISVTDQCGEIIDCNKKFEEITGYKREEVLGENHKIVNSGYHPSSFYEILWEEISQGNIWHGEIKNKAKDGSFYWVDAVIVPALQEDNMYHYYSVQRDISERKRAEEAAIQLAYFDSVTGLANRQSFESELYEKMKSASTKEHIALLFLDMDRFKYTNDTLGHKIGDQILQQIAVRLQDCLGEHETSLARVGGDEFAVIVSNIQSYPDIYKVVNVVKAVFTYPFVAESHQVYLTTSIGVSVFPEDGTDTFDLLRNAHNALHYAKKTGKNKVQFFKKEMNSLSERLFTLENELYQAYEDEAFSLSFQPRVDVKSGSIVGAEALIRWQLKNGQTVSPSEFIPLAEEIGLIIPIGNWAIRKVCELNKRWQDEGLLPIPISVNLSTQHLRQRDLVKTIQKILDETKLSPKYLEIEITENIFVENTELVIQVLSDLKKLGIKIALDDFGTGYCSLSYLKKFAIDIVKIDQSFIHNLPDNPVDTAIVNSVLELARILRKKVIAEGVENQQQLLYLYEHGCDMIQGFYYSRPLTINEFEKLLSKDRASIFSPINVDVFDRRKYFRIDFCSEDSTTLSLLSFDHHEKTIEEISINSINLSSGGIQFNSNTILQANSSKYYKIKGKWNEEEIEFIGVIVWGKEIGKELYEYGLKFYLTDQQRHELDDFLFKING